MSGKRMLGPEAIRVLTIPEIALSAPFFHGISAGFPSPAEDYHEEELNVGDYLVKNPSATFFIRVQGDSMTGSGIYPNDILVVDRSLPARDQSIVIAILNGEFTVKRLSRQAGVIRLVPENPHYQPTTIREGDEFAVWGVVAHVLHKPV